MQPEELRDKSSISEQSRRTVLRQGIIGALALGTGLTGTTGSVVAQTTDENSDDESSTANVTFRNQLMDGTRVVVESVYLPDGGYVGIHDARFFEDDHAYTVIAASERLEAGTTHNVKINLFSGIHGVYFESGEIEHDQWLVAVPYRETNGNELYEFAVTQEDGPYTEAREPIADVAFATIEDAETTTS